MSTDGSEQLGHLDDEAEEREPAAPEDAPAALGDYDPEQGSPGGAHPVGEDFPQESTRYDDPEHRRPSNE